MRLRHRRVHDDGAQLDHVSLGDLVEVACVLSVVEVSLFVCEGELVVEFPID